jgi:hypothetical protein
MSKATKTDHAIDTAWDVVHVVIAAALLAFVAFAWTTNGVHVAWCIFVLFGSAYSVGRWHSSRSWKRDFDNMAARYERLADKALGIKREDEP